MCYRGKGGVNMPKISEVKDIYLNNVVCCKQEDIMRMPASLYVLASPTTSISEEQDVVLTSNIKNMYLETPEGVSIIPEASPRATTKIKKGENFKFSYGSNGQLYYNTNDYLKIIVYNTTNEKTPIYYELFNMNNSDWVFVESGTKSSSSQLGNYNISLNNNKTGMETTISLTGNYIVCIKLFNSKK